MDHESIAAVGTVVQLNDQLRELLSLLRKPEEWGGASDVERVYWDPAAPAGGAALSAEYFYDGTFVSVGIFNLSAAAIRVALTPNASRRDATALLTLSARGFIVLPLRGVTVSVSGDAAGSALIVPCEVPQPLNAGTF